jgi:hypothetical protein
MGVGSVLMRPVRRAFRAQMVISSMLHYGHRPNHTPFLADRLAPLVS